MCSLEAGRAVAAGFLGFRTDVIAECSVLYAFPRAALVYRVSGQDRGSREERRVSLGKIQCEWFFRPKQYYHGMKEDGMRAVWKSSFHTNIIYMVCLLASHI